MRIALLSQLRLFLEGVRAYFRARNRLTSAAKHALLWVSAGGLGHPPAHFCDHFIMARQTSCGLSLPEALYASAIAPWRSCA
jgi:hypothetical protein